MKTILHARESVAFDEEMVVRDTAGNPIDITGMTFALVLQRQAGSPDVTLGMAEASGDEGFFIIDGPTGVLRMVIDQATLAGIEDTTGNFTMFGDLLGTPSGGEARFISDVRMTVTTAGNEFAGATYRLILDALGVSVLAQIDSYLANIEEEGDTQVERVTAEGDTQVERVSTEGGAQIELAEEQVALAEVEAAKLANYRPVRLLYQTRALAVAALEAGDITDNTEVFIRADEAYDGKFTRNFVREGGWDMVYVETLPFTPQEVLAGRVGAFYLPAKKGGLYQDRSFASPVTASGQSVAAMVDRSRERPDETIVRRNLFSRTDNMAPGVWSYDRITVKQRFEYPTVGLARLARLEETAQTGTHSWARTMTLSAGSHTLSVIAKADQRTSLRLQLDGGYADFDLSAGTVGAPSGLTSAAIADLGDGLYRCSVMKTVTAGSKTAAVFFIKVGSTSYLGTVLEGLYIGAPQLEAGALTDYQPVQEDSLGWTGKNTMVAPQDADRPTYIEEDGIGRLRFNGTAHFMRCGAFDLLNAEKAMTVVAFARSVGTGLSVWLHHGAGNLTGAREFFFNYTSSGDVAAGYGDGGRYQLGKPVHTNTVPKDRLLAFTYDPSNTDQRVTARVDGRLCPIDLAENSFPLSGEEAHAMAVLTLGGRRASNDSLSLRAEFDLSGLFIVSGTLSEAEIFACQQYLIEETGITPDFSSYIATERDNLWDSKIGTYDHPRWRVSPMSRIVFDTEATELTLHLWNDMTNADFRHVEVNVDGAFFAQISPGATGYSTHTVSDLPFGAKRVELINGLQAASLGTYVLGVGSDDTLTPVEEQYNKTIHVFADSIGVSDAATNPIREGGFMLARANAPAGTRVLVDGYGVNSWFDQVGDSTKRAAAVARLVASEATTFYGQLSVNDFNFRATYWGGSPSAMATAIGLFLDDLIVAMPDLEVILQTMLPTTVAGDQAAWRAAIAGLATGRDYVTIADGTAMTVTTGDLDDGVHPTTAGHLKWYEGGIGPALGWA